jgi:hypothetical protein
MLSDIEGLSSVRKGNFHSWAFVSPLALRDGRMARSHGARWRRGYHCRGLRFKQPTRPPRGTFCAPALRGWFSSLPGLRSL